MKLRKVMALTLAGTMALAAVGCGSDASTTNAQNLAKVVSNGMQMSTWSSM